MTRTIDRQAAGEFIVPRWQELKFDEVKRYVEANLKLHPDDPHSYYIRAQSRMLQLAHSGTEVFSKPESAALVKDLKKAISLFDRDQLKRDLECINEAAFVQTLLATVYLTSGKTKALNQSAQRAAEWVTSREFPPDPDLYINPAILAEAYIKLSICHERLKISRTKYQAAMVGAVANYRRAGDVANMNMAIRCHVEAFGYAPISAENMAVELPKFLDAQLGGRNQ